MSEIFFISPPSYPVKLIENIFFFFARVNALIIFLLFPLVEIPIITSPEQPIDSSCLLKIFSNP